MAAMKIHFPVTPGILPVVPLLVAYFPIISLPIEPLSKLGVLPSLALLNFMCGCKCYSDYHFIPTEHQKSAHCRRACVQACFIWPLLPLLSQQCGVQPVIGLSIWSANNAINPKRTCKWTLAWPRTRTWRPPNSSLRRLFPLSAVVRSL